MPRGRERKAPLVVSIDLTGRRDAWEHLLPKAQHGFFGPALRRCSAIGCSVRSDVIKAEVTALPSLWPTARAASSLRSRKEYPLKTGTRALTIPPNRVPAPPARITCATWLRLSASRPSCKHA